MEETAALGPNLDQHMCMMRRVRAIKRDEREYERQRPQRLEAKRLALINYALWPWTQLPSLQEVRIFGLRL